MDELSVKCLLYADDQVILALSACELQEMVIEMNDYVKVGLDKGVSKGLVHWQMTLVNESQRQDSSSQTVGAARQLARSATSHHHAFHLMALTSPSQAQLAELGKYVRILAELFLCGSRNLCLICPFQG
ncbi:hypothetical protein EVAR_66732_1 [Eumeta japonica]|uniref:Reverse transcriptase domain-containing protein n=1 Tax=Eumeta variegata TaxID=151549 RepID=A0A4C1T816_EUMVA|nr:hypothetical protein EVAR_66732_1 [Eumeta japonica]